jgi:hypothetical protein
MTALTWRRCRRAPDITTGMAGIAASTRAGAAGLRDLMQTSNFAAFRGSCDPNLVSIALRFPRGWGGRRYRALAPRREMLTMDETSSREAYQKILECLDPQKVFDGLGENAILLCWEARANSVAGAWWRHGWKRNWGFRCRNFPKDITTTNAISL